MWSGSSTQQEQSVTVGPVAEIPSVTGHSIPGAVRGRWSEENGRILRVSVVIGRFQYFEVRITKDRIMLKMDNAYAHVV
jgi:hypothetical protein